MGHTPHEIAAEFPQEAEQIAALRQSDAHFARLVDEYHEVNQLLHRAETNIEPTDERHEMEMRKNRMHLKDQIWQMLVADQND